MSMQDPLADMLTRAEESVTLAMWSKAIDTLNQLRAEGAEYEPARVASLFCDAYVGRGLDTVANISSQDNQPGDISQAQQDFDAGVGECPRRTDLQEQAERAAAYLVVLETPATDYETVIHTLTPIVAADPHYASGFAKQTLYLAYLGRAAARQQSQATIAAALGDYEAALALQVDDPSDAQTRRAELLLAFTQQPSSLPEPVETDASAGNGESPTPAPTDENATPVATSAAPVVRIKYSKPTLVAPPDDTIFAGQFAEVFLEWEPVNLAPDEYYDLTIMHLFADEPNYTGSTSTREPRVQIAQDIGVGEAGGDRFYWWVTVRKENSAPARGGADLPLSPRSDAATFVWSP